ncbi:MAG: protein-(glutamine-N5) methyltransferase, release factor-specific [Bacteroidetes bacterium 4572_112]|nr:MAG: protein-(glutamine-N5) methyltransferase, release factor-specific [Bacteroidetes bacterium 4572_112]
MKVRSNKISDIIKHYQLMLNELYDSNSSNQLLRELISYYINIPFNEVSLHFNKRVSESQLLDIHFGVKRLLQNEPIQYIIGETEFLDLRIKVNPNTLIPRPETEELVMKIEESINKSNSKDLSIIDIGSGSGCIAIAIQKITKAKVIGIDFSEEALKTAKENAAINNAEVDFKKVDFLNESERNKLPKFDIIISNPPYVQNSEKELMSKNVLDFEPNTALFVENNNPLIFYKAIAQFAKTHLNEGGSIWLEINEYLAEETAELFRNEFNISEIIIDFRDNARFIHVY